MKAFAAFSKARNDTKRIARKCANDFWLNICENIQLSADCGNIHSMYEGMKKAFGPSIIKVSPLKSISGDTITNRGEQMKRWAEHFQELYSKETVVADTTI